MKEKIVKRLLEVEFIHAIMAITVAEFYIVKKEKLDFESSLLCFCMIWDKAFLFTFFLFLSSFTEGYCSLVLRILSRLVVNPYLREYYES